MNKKTIIGIVLISAGVLSLSRPSLGSAIVIVGGVILVIFGVLSKKKSDQKKQPRQFQPTTVPPVSPVSPVSVPFVPVVKCSDSPKYRDMEQITDARRVVPTVTNEPPSKRPIKDDLNFTRPNLHPNYKTSLVFPFVAFDVETTGLDANTDDIVEVSAIKYEKGFVPVAYFSCICNSLKEISPTASRVNGLTQNDLENAPYFSQIRNSFSDFIKGCHIVGHNLPFDTRFLFVNGVDFDENVSYYDTLTLAKQLFDRDAVGSFSLESLSEHFGISHGTLHHALYDTEATAELFKIEYEQATSPDSHAYSQYGDVVSLRATVERGEDDADFVGKTFVFTGDMKSMTREEAIIRVIAGGGDVKTSVSSRTDVLVDAAPDEVMTSKRKKALELQEQGKKIKIINEEIFLKMLESSEAIQI